jgi:hypothetical protein
MRKGRFRSALRFMITVSVSNRDYRIACQAWREASYLGLDMAPQSFTADELRALEAEVNETLKIALGRMEAEDTDPWAVAFHIKTPIDCALGQRFVTQNGEITMLPSAFDKKEGALYSAIAIKTKAGTKEAAKVAALAKFSQFCAAVCLAKSQFIDQGFPKWPRGKAFPQVFQWADDFIDAEMYPPRFVTARENPLPHWVKRIDFVWDGIQSLPADKAERFTSSLFAFYSGMELLHSQPTMASVAFMAALGALAAEKRKKCDGEIACSCCGSLGSFKHDLVGDRKAIETMILELCNWESDPTTGKKVAACLRRLYSDQRSGYVHGAKLRHGEFNREGTLPSSFPTAESFVSDTFTFEADLLSIWQLTRRVLLEWLGRETHRHVDYALFDIDPQKFELSAIVQMQVTLPPWGEVTMDSPTRH